jgi:hypothetical protein
MPPEPSLQICAFIISSKTKAIKGNDAFFHRLPTMYYGRKPVIDLLSKEEHDLLVPLSNTFRMSSQISYLIWNNLRMERYTPL